MLAVVGLVVVSKRGIAKPYEARCGTECSEVKGVRAGLSV